MKKGQRFKKTLYSEEYKLSVLRDYYENGSSKSEISRKWHLSGPTLIKSWLERYPISSESLSLSRKLIDDLMKKHSPQTKEEELTLRIKELEKALELEKLRSLAYSTMIDIAEKEFNIPIRKKPGTKQ
jgi:transposase